MKILVIPEDQELDRYILKPVVEALFADLEWRAQIEILPEPRLRGTGDALAKDMIDTIVANNPMVDLFLLIIDRDCDREQNEAKAAARAQEHADKLLACLAHQEVEVWMLALYKDQLGESFSDVRAHCDPKEAYAEPLLAKLGRGGPGKGRKSAMRELSGKWRSLRDSCPELRDLQARIEAWRAARGPA